MNLTTNEIIKLIISVGCPVVLGAMAGIFTSRAIPQWYVSLNQPSFNPPNWVFGPVWTILYILMGISFYFIWQFPSTPVRNAAITIYIVQLLLNFAWTFIFFYFKKIGLAFAEIILMWIAILVMIIAFYHIRPLAAWLNIPYLLWVTFASVLNGAYYKLN